MTDKRTYAIVSSGYGDTYIVNKAGEGIISNAVILLPMQEKVAYEILKVYAKELPDDNESATALKSFLESCKQYWDDIERQTKW